jgi:hypothetical protein
VVESGQQREISKEKKEVRHRGRVREGYMTKTDTVAGPISAALAASQRRFDIGEDGCQTGA